MYRTLTCILFALLAGCSKPPAPAQGGADEEAVKTAFVAFQEAMKGRDGEKIWGLLDSDSQSEAGRAAQSIKDAYGKATPTEKGDTEKAMGLSAAELAAIDAKAFLKSKRFHGKYDEIAESKFDKATIQGEKATVTYVEPDGDKEKLTLVKQGGQWKVSIPMPK